MIEIRNLAKTYRTRSGDVPSLRPINLDITEGEFVAVVGPSGCGKSTLLKLVAGLIPPSEGEVQIGGVAVREPPDDVGIVFQSPGAAPWRSVLRNVMMPVEVRKLDRESHLARARKLLAMAGLEDFQNKYPWQLSGGMQQRTAICRALVHDPKITHGRAVRRPRCHDARAHESRAPAHPPRDRQDDPADHAFHSRSGVPMDRVVVMSERPGTIAAIYDVTLPRPRNLEVMGHPTFVDLTQRIRGHFYARGHLD